MPKQIKEKEPDKTDVVKFDKSRFQLSTNNKSIIKKLKDLKIEAYGYAMKPYKTQPNTILMVKFDNYSIYLINEETLNTLKNTFNENIIIQGEKAKNGRRKKSQ
jgi:hypothetical protein